MLKEKGFAPLIIILGMLIILVIVGTLYYFGTVRNKPLSQNPVVNSQNLGNQQPDKVTQIMQDLGCDSQISCLSVCSKTENSKKCQNLMLEISKGGVSGSNKQMNVLSTFNQADVPPITANVMNINQIFAISQFRSNAGHDYSYDSWDGETCRSMKHYFNMGQYQVNGMVTRSTPGPGETNINIYSPFDGTIIANVSEKTPIGTQVHIASSKNPSYYVRLFHIDLLPSLNVGSIVKSGDLVGTIGPKDGMDVSYEALLQDSKIVYLSIFDYMTSQAFTPYSALGYKPSDFVLTREQADTKGYKCNGEQFSNSPGYTPSNGQSVGYIYLKANPYNYLFSHNQSSQQGQNR